MNLPMPKASERNRNRKMNFGMKDIIKKQSSDSDDSESDESNNRPVNHFNRRWLQRQMYNDDVIRNDIKSKQRHKSSDDEDKSSSDSDRKMESNLKYKRKQTMRRIHSRKK